MLIALYFSGRIITKDFDYFIKFLIDLRSKYDIIFFCSLNQENIDDYTIKFCKLLDIDEQRLNIEKTNVPDEIYNYKKNKETNYTNTYSMFYHNKRCTELIEKYEINTGILFDVIVKYRGDIIPNETMKIEYPEPNTLYIPDGKDYSGINDQISYGNKKAMKQYSECVDNIIKYCKSGVIYNPERLLRHHIRYKELKIKRYDYEYNLSRLRIRKQL